MLKKTCNVKNMTALCVALESGEYAQTTGYLRRHGGYCCAGVAGVLAEADGVGVYDDQGTFRDTGSEPGFDPFDSINGDTGLQSVSDKILTAGIIGWLGIEATSVSVNMPVNNLPERKRASGNPAMTGATGLNDEGFTFPVIAKLLRDTYLD